MTLNLIKALKITIYITKHTQRTKIYFHKSIFQDPTFQEKSTFIRISMFCLFVSPGWKLLFKTVSTFTFQNCFQTLMILKLIRFRVGIKKLHFSCSSLAIFTLANV